ncbi:MAG: DNA polymerase III subunit delta', partial [Pseudomonadota bacterium]
VSAGSHPSLLHLTRAYDDKTKRFKSELSVDTVRRIVPFLGTSAAGNGWRVVIVDAVDDLNINAANALLKSLEEPPRRTLFFLVAHVAGRVLPTIRSRCQTVRLRPLSETEVADVLRHLGADESVADLAQGSVQRALTLSSSGPDAVRTAQRLLNGSLRDPRPRFQLADLASEKRGEYFQVVADLTLEAIATRARQSAAQAPLEALNALAQAYLSALAERRRVEVFNLDRKEYMLALCDRLAHAEGLMRR